VLREWRINILEALESVGPACAASFSASYSRAESAYGVYSALRGSDRWSFVHEPFNNSTDQAELALRIKVRECLPKLWKDTLIKADKRSVESSLYVIICKTAPAEEGHQDRLLGELEAPESSSSPHVALASWSKFQRNMELMVNPDAVSEYRLWLSINLMFSKVALSVVEQLKINETLVRLGLDHNQTKPRTLQMQFA